MTCKSKEALLAHEGSLRISLEIKVEIKVDFEADLVAFI